MIKSIDDPGCYKAYVWGEFIHNKTTQTNEQDCLKIIFFTGTNLPHKISNLEQIAYFPFMITHAIVSIVFHSLRP